MADGKYTSPGRDTDPDRGKDTDSSGYTSGGSGSYTTPGDRDDIYTDTSGNNPSGSTPVTGVAELITYLENGQLAPPNDVTLQLLQSVYTYPTSDINAPIKYGQNGFIWEGKTLLKYLNQFVAVPAGDKKVITAVYVEYFDEYGVKKTAWIPAKVRYETKDPDNQGTGIAPNGYGDGTNVIPPKPTDTGVNDDKKKNYTWVLLAIGVLLFITRKRKRK